MSALFVARRLFAWFSFEKKRRLQRSCDRSFRRIETRLGTVGVYRSCAHRGSPFTGDLFSSYICVPEETYQALNQQELEAVILHEFAHIRRFDFLITLALGFIGDCFWIIPGWFQPSWSRAEIW